MYSCKNNLTAKHIVNKHYSYCFQIYVYTFIKNKRPNLRKITNTTAWCIITHCRINKQVHNNFRLRKRGEHQSKSFDMRKWSAVGNNGSISWVKSTKLSTNQKPSCRAPTALKHATVFYSKYAPNIRQLSLYL